MYELPYLSLICNGKLDFRKKQNVEVIIRLFFYFHWLLRILMILSTLIWLLDKGFLAISWLKFRLCTFIHFSIQIIKMLWISFQFNSQNEKMDSEASRTRIKPKVEKLSKDTRSFLNHLVLCDNTCLIERMAYVAHWHTNKYFTALKGGSFN